MSERLQTEKHPDAPNYDTESLKRFVQYINLAKLSSPNVCAAIIGIRHAAQIKINVPDQDRHLFHGDKINGVKIVVCEGIEGNDILLLDSEIEAYRMKNEIQSCVSLGMDWRRVVYWRGYNTREIT